MENWVEIKQINKPGYYVSDLGRIKVIRKKTVIKLGYVDTNGYCVFSYAFKMAPLKVHQAVLESFTVRPNWAECINHKNGIKTDNRLENLEWCTHKQNSEHAWSTGLIKHIGANHPLSKDIKLVHRIYEMKKLGFRQCDIMRDTGLTRKRVQAIYSGHDWRYEYKKFFQ